MADVATRQALAGGDLDVWAPFEQAHNHLSIGVNTRKLYIDTGTLYLSAGMIGLYNGTQYYAITNSAARSISVAALTASCWARIELSVAAGVVVTDITSIAGETDPETLPASFTGAYDGTKGGHYVTATKRCVGLVWINAGGDPEGVINAIGNCDGYSGYSTSDDAIDIVYTFLKIGEVLPHAAVTVEVTSGGGGVTVNTPDVTNFAGASLTIKKIDTGAGAVTITNTFAQTYDSMTAIGQYEKGQFVTLAPGASEWLVLAHSPQRAVFEHQQPKNTAAGDFTTGADRTMVLNTTVKNHIYGCSLNANQVTTPIGRYRIWWDCPAYRVDGFQSWLHDATAGALLRAGTSSYAYATSNGHARSDGWHDIVNAATRLLEVRAYCTTTKAGDGFGRPANVATTNIEVFGRLIVEWI